MASGFAVLLILVGIFLVIVGFQTISDCSTTFPGTNCWLLNPFRASGAGYDYSAGLFSFYAGLIMAGTGAVVIVGGYAGRRWLGWSI